MIPNLLLLVSDWNPQFFREFKGRLKPRNIALTIATSLLVQGAILLYLWAALPGQKSTYSHYCTGKGDYFLKDCILDAIGNPMVNWQAWWFDLFQTLSWLLPFVLLVAGVYMLIGDLAKEERRGTLNFIRLSPRSSQSVLIGKLLGVPLIPFLAVALAVPLHIWCAAQAGISIGEVSSIYLVTLAACCFFYVGSIFYAFLGGAQSWLGAAAVWLSYTVFFQLWQVSQNWSDAPYLGLKQWYYLWIGQSLPLAVAFAVMNFGMGTFWIWQAINRRFRNPNQTLISKRQSYAMTLYFELLMFGFVFRENQRWDHPIYDLMTMVMFNLAWFLVLIATLTPHRQTLLDWARYRWDGAAKAKRIWRRSLLRDLVWGEKSPAMVAIALNLLIAIAVFTPWILTWEGADQQVRGFLSLVFCMLFMLICAAIAQSILFIKFQKRAIFAAGVIGVLIALPAIAMLTLGVHPNHNPSVWLFSAFAFVSMEFASATAIIFGFLAHLAVLSLLTLRLTRQLRQAGGSELKALMAQQAL